MVWVTGGVLLGFFWGGFWGGRVFGGVGWFGFFSLREKPAIFSISKLSFLCSYFSLQPVLHDWCNKGRGMCYPVCGMVHIKEPLLLISKSSPCGGSRFPLTLSDWSFTICPTPYNHKWKKCVECILKKQILPSFLFYMPFPQTGHTPQFYTYQLWDTG